MCSHYSWRRKELNRIADQLAFAEMDRFLRDRYNVAPTQPTAAVRLGASGAPELVEMRWGLIPAWAKERPKAPHINARSETAATLATFRSAFRSRHCILPATAYYEFPGKSAYAIRAVKEAPLLLAGLWEEHPTEGLSCTMLTCEPNARLAEIHHRMPVVLTATEAEVWLAGGPEAGELLRPCASDLLHFYPVSRDAANWRNDAPYLLEPLATV